MGQTSYTPIVLLVAAAFAVVPAHAAKLYKWVDDEGNVTYSQQKPPDREVKQLDLKGYRPANAEAAADEAEQAKDQADAQRKDEEFADASQDALKQREARLRKNCEIARQNLRVLTNSARIQAKGADGKPYFLGAEDIKARIAETQRQIKDWCT